MPQSITEKEKNVFQFYALCGFLASKFCKIVQQSPVQVTRERCVRTVAGQADQSPRQQMTSSNSTCFSGLCCFICVARLFCCCCCCACCACCWGPRRSWHGGRALGGGGLVAVVPGGGAFGEQDTLPTPASMASCGADSGLPSMKWQFMRFNIFDRMLPSKNFVIASDGFSVPRTLFIESRLSRSASCIHRLCVSRCLIFPRPFLWHIPIAALATTNR